MKKMITCFLLSLQFLIIGCDNNYEDSSEKYVPDKYDSLSYLVGKTDFVAVVNIVGGSGRFGESNNNEKSEYVDAEIVDIIYKRNDLDLGSSVKLSRYPHIKKPNSYGSFVIYTNGMTLIFANIENNQICHPTTLKSVMSIYDNNILPVWKIEESEKTNNYDYDLSDIKNEIIEHIKSRSHATQ